MGAAERHTLDARGLKCPQPILKIALKAARLESGAVLEVSGDCPTFEQDVRNWCQRAQRTLLAVVPGPGAEVTATIQF